MRILFFTLFLFTFAPLVMAAENGMTSSHQTEAHTHYCPMHPEETGMEGNNCPICGMHLVPKNEGNGSHEGHENKPEGAFLIDPSYIQTLGVKTSSVTHHEFGRNIRSFGQIEPSTRLEYAVDVRTKGWIVDLAVDAVGDAVKKGDLLFTYYSPDLMNAQSDFLIGSRVGNAIQRLSLFGMDDKAIAELKERGKFFEETPFYAPEDGTITMLSVRKGGYVNEGGSVLKLQDFSKVWVNADVPIRDVQFLEVKTPAKISIPETSASYDTAVDFIHPVNDPQNRTVTVRLVLDNPDGTLKPDTYVDAVFSADAQSRLAIPAEAVLYGGMGAYVIEDIGDGYFRPVMVQTGITSQGLTEITSGLSHGQSIVTSGQFMLDAESNLKGGMGAMGHDHGGEQMEGMTSQPTSQDGSQSHAH